ncbi:MAG: hypothetical protein HUU57_03930 [Bdellovibrio sp.]|nr:hypothetical protein [Bdellovibrio sp.]
MNLKSGDSSIYYKIQNHSLELSEKDIAHIFDMVRFDPRLMEVATELIRDFWWNMNPSFLNKHLRLSKFPYAIRPAISVILKNCEFPDAHTKTDFLKWYEVVVAGIKNPPVQLFYIGLAKIGSSLMRREESEAIPCFLDHNLLAKDIPFNKGMPGIVKTKEMLMKTKIDPRAALKAELSGKIKSFKSSNALTNGQVSEKLGINRVFMSQIMNNNLEHITVDYLMEKTRDL